jgi:hypothetical protein
MENNNFTPMPTPPPEIAKALGWRTSATPEELEEKAVEKLFARAETVSNPWLVKPGQNGIIAVPDGEAEAEKEFAAGIEPIKKLFAPKEPAGRAPALGSLPARFEEPDDEERELYSPVHKLFHPDAITTVTPAAASKQFTKRAASVPDAPPAKKTLTYKKHRDENGLLWSEGYSADGALQSYMLVIDESEE